MIWENKVMHIILIAQSEIYFHSQYFDLHNLHNIYKIAQFIRKLNMPNVGCSTVLYTYSFVSNLKIFSAVFFCIGK